MNTEPMKSGGIWKNLGIIPLLTACLAINGFGQSVVIEGGPNGTRISNRDGKTEGSASSSNRQETTVPLPANTSIGQGFGNISPVRFRNVSLPQSSTQPSTTPFPLPDTPVRPDEVISPPVVDVGKQKQLAQIERELGIQRTSVYAGLSYEANLIFESGQSTVSNLAKPILDRLSNYLVLAEGKSISIPYRYKTKEDSAELGMARAQSLIAYLSEKSSIPKEKFTVPPPKPSTQAVVDHSAFTGNTRPEYKSVVSVVVHRQ